MFSNEFFENETKTVVMDETGSFEDIEIHITDDCVYLRQFNIKSGLFEVLMCTHKMWYDVIESRNHTEGFFTTKLRPQR